MPQFFSSLFMFLSHDCHSFPLRIFKLSTLFSKNRFLNSKFSGFQLRLFNFDLLSKTVFYLFHCFVLFLFIYYMFFASFNERLIARIFQVPLISCTFSSKLPTTSSPLLFTTPFKNTPPIVIALYLSGLQRSGLCARTNGPQYQVDHAHRTYAGAAVHVSSTNHEKPKAHAVLTLGGREFFLSIFHHFFGAMG